MYSTSIVRHPTPFRVATNLKIPTRFPDHVNKGVKTGLGRANPGGSIPTLPTRGGGESMRTVAIQPGLGGPSRAGCWLSGLQHVRN